MKLSDIFDIREWDIVPDDELWFILNSKRVATIKNIRTEDKEDEEQE